MLINIVERIVIKESKNHESLNFRIEQMRDHVLVTITNEWTYTTEQVKLYAHYTDMDILHEITYTIYYMGSE